MGDNDEAGSCEPPGYWLPAMRNADRRLTGLASIYESLAMLAKLVEAEIPD